MEVHRKQNMLHLHITYISETTKKLGVSFSKKVFLQGPKTFVVGDNLPHLEKKLEYKEKSYNFCLFLPNYYLAIASGAHNLVAYERKLQECSEMV